MSTRPNTRPAPARSYPNQVHGTIVGIDSGEGNYVVLTLETASGAYKVWTTRSALGKVLERAGFDTGFAHNVSQSETVTEEALRQIVAARISMVGAVSTAPEAGSGWLDVSSADKYGVSVAPGTLKERVEAQAKEQARQIDPHPTPDWPAQRPPERYHPVSVPGAVNIPGEPGVTRIGYATFTNPIQHVAGQRTSYLEQAPTLREPGTIKKGTGFSYQTYTLSWLATGPWEIESSVQEVLEQIILNPFVSCSGGPFGDGKGDGDIPYVDFAVRSFTLSTVPGFPDSISVQMAVEPFLFDHYCQITENGQMAGPEAQRIQTKLDDIACWPLVTLWAKSRGRSSFTPGAHLTGSFSLSFPTTKAVESVIQEAEAERRTLDDSEAFRGLKSLMELGESPSDAAKELVYPAAAGRRFYAVTLVEEDNWALLTQDPAFVGLIPSEKIAGRFFVGSDGRLAPSSSRVDLANGSAFLSNSTGIAGASVDEELPFLSVAAKDFRGAPQNSMKAALLKERKNRAPAEGQSVGTTIVNDALSDDRIAEILKRPWEYFTVVLAETSGGELAARVAARASALSNRHNSVQEGARARYLRILENDDNDDLLVLQGAGDMVVDAGEYNNSIIVESIAGTRQSNLSANNVTGMPLPLHQYLGGGTSEFVVQGKCVGAAAKSRLEGLKAEFDKRCQQAFTGPLAGNLRQAPESAPFLWVRNEVFQLMGVDFVMPATLSIESIPELPGVWAFEMSLLEYSPKAQAAERIRFIQTTPQAESQVLSYQESSQYPQFRTAKHPTLVKAEEFFSLNGSLSRMDLYPDMELPTFEELNTWVDILREEGQFRLKNGAAKPVKAGGQASARTRWVVDACERYLEDPHCLARIAGFGERKADDRTRGAYTQVFVDPDFFCCYDPSTSWGAVLDKLALEELGWKPGMKQGTTPDSTKAAFYREFSPLSKTYTVFGSEFHSAPAADTHTILKKASREAVPQANHKQYTELVEQHLGDDQFPGMWKYIKRDTASVDDTDTYFDQNEAAMFGPFVGKHDFITDVEEPAAESGINTAAMSEALSEFMSIKWRQEALVRAIMAGSAESKTYSGSVVDLDSYENSGFLIRTKLDSIGERVANFVARWTEGFLGNDTTRNLGGRVPTPDALAVADAVNEGTETLDSLLKKALDQAGSPFKGGADDVLSFVQRTKLTSSNYYRWLGHENALKDYLYSPGPDTNSATGALLSTRELVDRAAGRYEIDPHIVRAFFLRRSGLGSVDLSAVSPSQAGIGGMSPQIEKAQDGDPRVQVDLFCSRFKSYLSKYKLPTLALCATYAELTDKGREAYWRTGAMDPKLDSMLSGAAAKLSSKETRFTPEGLSTLQEVVGQTPFAGEIDGVWSGYIEVSRVLGPARTDSGECDALFFPLHLYILQDNGANSGYISTAFTPSGNRMRIAQTRAEVSMNTADVRLSNPDIVMTQEQDSLMRARLRFGLEPHNEALAWATMLDARRYTVFGRLVQAFPSFRVLLINEGFYFAEGSIKLWDQFYTRGGITSIEVVRSTKSPADTCAVTFSNLFYGLTRYTQAEALRHEMAVNANYRLQRTLGLNSKGTWDPSGLNIFERLYQSGVLKQPSPEFLQTWKYNHLQQLALTAGARMQVRMGYGNNAATLPIVFNGTVVEAPSEQGLVTVVAAGDGWELERPVTDRLGKVEGGYAFNSQQGLVGSGSEPAQIVAQAMVPNKMVLAAASDGRWGVTRIAPHFGDINFRNSSGYSTAEVVFNMYGASRKNLEQEFDGIGGFFNKNALYNWDDTQLISVSVSQPTVWKTAHVCRRAVIDFVTAPQPFHTGNTLFFGKWWYPFNYEFAPSILELSRPEQAYGKKSAGTTGTSPRQAPAADGSDRDGALAGMEIDPRAEEALPKLLRDWFHSEYPEHVIVRASESSVGTPSAVGPWKRTFVVASVQGSIEVLVLQYDPTTLGYLRTNPRLVEVEKSTLEAARAAMEDTISRKESRGILPDYQDGSLRTDYEVPLPRDREYSALNDVEYLVTHMKWKPFIQVWPAYSGLNLISNSIVADSTKVYTDAVGQNGFNGWLTPDTISKTLTYSVDSDISPSVRRTMLVDTGLTTSTIQRGFVRTVSDAAAKILATTQGWLPWTPAVTDAIKEMPDTQAVENSVVSALVDSVKEMYQGWFTIMGQAAIKPHDLILLNDCFNALEGPVFVRDVIHRMDAQTGFVTMISPAAVAVPSTTLLGQRLLVAMATGPAAKASQYMVGKVLWAVLTLNWGVRKAAEYTARMYDMTEAIKDANKALRFPATGDATFQHARSVVLNELEEKLAKAQSETRLAHWSKGRRVRALKAAIKNVESADSYYALVTHARVYGLKLTGLAPQESSNALRTLMREIAESEAYYGQYYKELKASQRTTAALRGRTDAQLAELARAQALKQFEQERLPRIRAALGDKGEKAFINTAIAEQEKKLAAVSKNLYADVASAKTAEEAAAAAAKITPEMIQAQKEAIAEAEKEMARLTKLRNALDPPDPSALDTLTKNLDDILRNPQGTNDLIDALRKANNALGAEDIAELETLLKDTAKVAAARSASPSTKLIALLSQAEEGIQDARIAAAAKVAAKGIGKIANVASFIGPQIILRVALEVFKFGIGQGMIQAVSKNLAARQMVKIIPLRSIQSPGQSIPFTAGIRGHQGAVIGDEPGFVDKIISGRIGPDVFGVKLSLLVGAVLGVEIPEYGDTQEDTDVYNYLRKVRMERGIEKP